MILNTVALTPDLHEQGIQMAEEIFDTHSHPEQMQTSQENFQRLKSLSPNSILYEVVDGNKLAGWVVIVPTTKLLAQEFINGKIGEQALLEMTKSRDKYDALYLCVAGVKPEFRRQGIAFKLLKEAINRAPLTKNYKLFAWPTTPEGMQLTKKLESETGKVINIRK